jgi:hypothetical protein
MALGVKVLIGVGLVFALVMASGPLLNIVDFFSGWEVVDGEPTEPGTTEPPATSPPAAQPTALPGFGAGSDAEPYRQIGAAEWADIVRNPSGHEGRRVVLFGRITAPPVPGSPSLQVTAGPARLDDPAEYATPVLVTRVEITEAQAGWPGYRVGDEVQINGTITGLRADPDAGAGTGTASLILALAVRDEIAVFRR